MIRRGDSSRSLSERHEQYCCDDQGIGQFLEIFLGDRVQAFVVACLIHDPDVDSDADDAEYAGCKIFIHDFPPVWLCFPFGYFADR